MEVALSQQVKRVYRSDAEWIEIVEGWRASDLCVKDFCEQEQIKVGTFYAARSRLANESKSAFIELSVEPVDSRFLVTLPNELMITVPAQFSEETLVRLVSTLAHLP